MRDIVGERMLAIPHEVGDHSTEVLREDARLPHDFPAADPEVIFRFDAVDSSEKTMLKAQNGLVRPG